ncbi:MAG: hypothetical protein GY904_27255 [Planctomycetaceae bacterium]|nr:hypothetical protein [Planctomycetaceae bacterium]
MQTAFLVALIVILPCIFASMIGLLVAPRLPFVLRVLAAIQFVLIGLFCGFGFLASFEPGPGQLAWRTTYGVLGTGCVLAVVWLGVAKPRKNAAS